MYEAGVVTQFEAQHRLRGSLGPVSRRHGHVYRVEVNLKGPSLGTNDMLIDLALLERSVQEAVGTLHHRDLDEVAVFQGRQTTAEVVARYLFEHLAPSLRGLGLAALAVRVWESPRAFGGFEGPLA